MPKRNDVRNDSNRSLDDIEPTAACASPLDLDWITDQLAIGGRFSESAVEHLARQLGVQCVVDVRSEEWDDIELLREHGIAFLHLPTDDMCAVQRDALWTGVRWVSEALDKGRKVLIHCEHGIGRSALLACCVLVSQGHEPRRALQVAKQARRKVSPSPEQLYGYLGWISDWHAKNGTECPGVTWDELAQIAYSHLREDAPA